MLRHRKAPIQSSQVGEKRRQKKKKTLGNHSVLIKALAIIMERKTRHLNSLKKEGGGISKGEEAHLRDLL